MIGYLSERRISHILSVNGSCFIDVHGARLPDLCTGFRRWSHLPVSVRKPRRHSEQ